ncbi:MAG: hypothetical protein OXH96_04540 [Spirochaetaceae bacterium]|nr:hypothetical protein [Spirochaetaceae bacterium]
MSLYGQLRDIEDDETDARASPTSRLFGPGSLPSRQIANMKKVARTS